MIDADEKAMRATVVADAAHSSAMSNLQTGTEYRADAAAYVDGLIDVDELGRRTRRRYGVPEEDGQ
ncbi:antitoxin VbhA family protein [Microbacterium rhizomatis]|uniref:Antitoxin VbhA domain-containing protein n=1 Tax=Microbacterium rhizomatis TaxID=1631477 RepID=A0A5J5IXT3_9MICO|nr:antitoxin VbhA family protein [Microbacterium rhizomatis]KAA9104509.1 hypothetical protein F6B43_19260 [Microbacterium rhizomatis]